MTRNINIVSEKLLLVGVLHYPQNYRHGNSYPVIIIDGTITTVKEQMATIYAKELVQKGFIALTFDHRGFGASEGEPRFYEDYRMKIEDLYNIVTHLIEKEKILPNKIGLLGIGAGGVYSCVEASYDKRIKCVVSINPWINTFESVEAYFGGKLEIEKRINEAKAARYLYENSGKVTYVPIVSNKDKTAVIFGEMDYFESDKRGNIPQWSGNKFNVMSWEKLLKYFPMETSKNLSVPVMFIAIKNSIYAENIKTYYDLIRSEKKEIIWTTTPNKESDFYDVASVVSFGASNAARWFVKNL